MRTGDQERGIFFGARVCLALREGVSNMHLRVKDILLQWSAWWVGPASCMQLTEHMVYL